MNNIGKNCLSNVNGNSRQTDVSAHSQKAANVNCNSQMAAVSDAEALNNNKCGNSAEKYDFSKVFNIMNDMGMLNMPGDSQFEIHCNQKMELCTVELRQNRNPNAPKYLINLRIISIIAVIVTGVLFIVCIKTFCSSFVVFFNLFVISIIVTAVSFKVKNLSGVLQNDMDISLNFRKDYFKFNIGGKDGDLNLNEKIYLSRVDNARDNQYILTIYAANSIIHKNQNLFDAKKQMSMDKKSYYRGFTLTLTKKIAVEYFYKLFTQLFENVVISLPPMMPSPEDQPILVGSAMPLDLKFRTAKANLKKEKKDFVFNPGFLNLDAGMLPDWKGAEKIGKTQDPKGTIDESTTCGHRRYFDMVEIGMTSSGILYHAVDYSGRSVIIVVMDVIRTQEESYQSCFKHEIRVLENLRCAGVPSFVETFDEITCKYMVLASISAMPLSKVFDDKPSFILGVKLLHNLSGLLRRLSEADIVHIDISPETVLVDDRMNVRLVGFGRSVKSDTEVFLNESAKTIYMAPEIWERRVTPAADIYSVGIVVMAYLKGSPLRESDLSDEERKKNLLSELPDWFIDLIIRMTVSDVDHRISSAREIEDCIKTNVLSN